MKKLFSALLALGMLMTGFFGVAAQETSTSFAAGMNSPATWTDDRGNEVATVEVTDINPDWTDYSEYSEPERGYIFQAVTFTVENISDTNLIVEPFDFSLVDEVGRNNARAWVSLPEELEGTIFEDDLPLAAGENAELTLVFQTPADVAASVFVWQPDSGVLVMVNIGENSREDAAIATGLNAPSTWTDDRGNPVATFEITEIEDDWQDYGEYDEPGRGMQYRAVHFSVTNVSGSSLIVEPYSFTLVDNTGLNTSRAWAEAAEGSDIPVFTEDTPLADGETYEGVIIFEMYPDVSPSAMIWQPDSGLLNMVILADGGESTGATPEAGDDSVATPATDAPAAEPADDEAEGDEPARSAPTTGDDAEGDEPASSVPTTGDDDEGDVPAGSAPTTGDDAEGTPED